MQSGRWKEGEEIENTQEEGKNNHLGIYLEFSNFFLTCTERVNSKNFSPFAVELEKRHLLFTTTLRQKHKQKR